MRRDKEENFDEKVSEYIKNVLKYSEYGRLGYDIMKMRNLHLLDSDFDIEKLKY